MQKTSVARAFKILSIIKTHRFGRKLCRWWNIFINKKVIVQKIIIEIRAEGSWFNDLAVGGSGTPLRFPAPSGSLQDEHRLGISLNENTVSFYFDGKLLNSGDISKYLPPDQIENSNIEEEKPKAFDPENPPSTYTTDLNSSVNLEMIWCPPGTFTMGSPTTEAAERRIVRMSIM